MYNDLFSIGPLTFHTYGLTIAIGVLACISLAEKLAAHSGLDPESIMPLAGWCLVLGWSCSKLLYLFTIREELLQNPASITQHLTSGWVVYGGIIGGIIGAVLYTRCIKKTAFLPYFDVCMPAVSLAQGFGRLGCFFAGCCYGVETDSRFHIVFHHSDFAPNNVPLFPSQLISSAYDFALAALLVWVLRKRKPSAGVVGSLYLIFNSVGRFIIEFYRGDLARGSVGVLSTSQFIALFLFAGGVALALACKTLPRKST